MKYSIGITTIFTLLLISVESFSQVSLTNNEKAAIVELSDKYQEAIKSSDGEKLFPLVSSNSIKFYAKLQRFALWASPEELFEEEIYVIISSVILKKAFNFYELSSLTPKELIINSYTGHSSSLNTGSTISINTITRVDQNRVIVNYNIDNKKSTIDLAFVKENGEWKINLDDQMSLMFFPIQLRFSELAQQGYDKKEFVINVIETLSGMTRQQIIQPLNNQ